MNNIFLIEKKVSEEIFSNSEIGKKNYDFKGEWYDKNGDERNLEIFEILSLRLESLLCFTKKT